MATFSFTERVNDPHADIISAALGDDTNQYKTADVGKCMKLSTTAGSTYVACDAGDEIEAVVWAVDAGGTVNSGYSFGSVLRGRSPVTAEIASDQDGANPAAIGDLVVAGDGAVLGTKQDPMVKTGSPADFKWRIVHIISGAGAAGSKVLIERV